MVATSSNLVNENYTVTIMQYPDKNPSNAVMIQAPMPESFMYDAAAQYAAPFTGGLTGNQMIDTILRVGVAARLVTQSLTAQFWQGSTETELGLEIEFQAEQDPDKEVRQQVLKLLRLTTPSTMRGNLLTSPGPKFGKEFLDQIINDGKQFFTELYSEASAAAGVTTTPSGGATAPGGATPLVAGASNPNIGPGQLKTCGMDDPAFSVTNGSQTSAQSANPSDKPDFGTSDYFNQYISDRISIKIGNYALFNSVVVTNVQTTFESQFDQYGMPHYARVAIRFKPLFMVVQKDLDRIFLSGTSSAAAANRPPIAIGGTPPFVGPAIGSFEGLSPASGSTPAAVAVANPVYLPPDPRATPL